MNEQNKDRSRIILLTVIIVAILAIAGVGVGCWFAGRANGIENSHSVVSYASEETTVQSSTADLVKKVADSVVEIRTESTKTQWGMQYIVSGAGSGVIVGKGDNGTYKIITNNHVISGANDIAVCLRDGTEYSAKLIATDVAGDIAVIEIEESKELNVAVWGNSSELSIGEDLIAIGNPLGSLGGTVTKGILSATERQIAISDYPMTLLQTDTAINPGNSGGGLFNMRGELIGVVNAKTSDEEVEGICFAIPADIARAIYNDLLTYGYVTGRATFGLTVASGTMNNATVTYVTDASGAQSGTFQNYDRIAKIGDTEITSLLSYNTALSKLTVGEAVEVTVYRGKASQSLFGGGITFDSTPTVFTVTAEQLK